MKLFRRTGSVHNALLSDLLDDYFFLCKFKIMLSHNCTKLLIAGFLRIPAKNGLCLGRITPQVIHISWPEPCCIDFNQHTARSFIYAFSSIPLPCHSSSMPQCLNANVVNSRTVCCTPVAMTKSSGWSCWSISHMHST